jgi:hypothetical protein
MKIFPNVDVDLITIAKPIKKRPLARSRVLHIVKLVFNWVADKSVGCLPSAIFTHRTK